MVVTGSLCERRKTASWREATYVEISSKPDGARYLESRAGGAGAVAAGAAGVLLAASAARYLKGR